MALHAKPFISRGERTPNRPIDPLGEVVKKRHPICNGQKDEHPTRRMQTGPQKPALRRISSALRLCRGSCRPLRGRAAGIGAQI